MAEATPASHGSPQSEDLRQQGNAAFSQKKWKVAVHKYRASIAVDGESKSSAKAYSNLAAALCKLCKYDDAHEAAKMAPEVDPEWAKGHWRLGVVLELQKDFLHALGSYEKAVKLVPDEPVFAKYMDKMMKRLGCDDKRDSNGLPAVQPPPNSTSFKGNFDPLLPWQRLKQRTYNLANMRSAFPDEIRDGDEFKSEWWIQSGMWQWYTAMMRQLGEMADMPFDQNATLASEIVELKRLRQSGSMSQMEYDTRHSELTGQPPIDGSEFDEFLGALTQLGGEKIPLEMGAGKFVLSPPWLDWYTKQQVVAVLQSIFYKVIKCKNRLGELDTTDWSVGEQLVLSPAICIASKTYLGNTGQAAAEVGKRGTPEEVIEYCKQKLREGATWEDGIREFVGFVYRGTVLAAWLSRLIEGIGVALKKLKWARQFITLADKEWKVSENGDYSRYGATFRKSFQLGVLCMELHTAQTMRSIEDAPNVEIAVYEFNLAQSIIDIARKTLKPSGNSFQAWLFYTSFGRKPLAYACSYLASNLNLMRYKKDLFMAVNEKMGLFDPEGDGPSPLLSLIVETAGREEFSLISLIAETYRLAATNQLPDDQETTILWWGYAAHVADAGGYKIGDLRRAINNAIIASEKMDEDLFGPSEWENSSYQKKSTLLAWYYRVKPDDFILPMLEYKKRPDGSLTVFVDGQVLCMNFDRYERIGNKRLAETRSKEANSYLNTEKAEKEHGAEF